MGEMLMKKLKKQLLNLLSIHGVSGDEKRVRDYLKPILNSTMDSVVVDHYGNLLADKKMGDGNGATVMLSAHMDTVRAVLEDREIYDEDGIISSSKGALGADDRAGIAIILAVIRNLKKIDFNGHLKIAFSREEEIGCKGADQIDKDWYKDVDLAIVVDRRGARDIVVGCGMAFCSDSVGYFMENVSQLADMDWKCTEGGISDAMTFSSNGINSINLSAGYMNEHTDKEYVILDNMRDTARLILQTFAVINQFYKGFRDVGYENSWVQSWYKGQKSYYNYPNYYEDSYDDDIWAEQQDDKNGDIFVYELAGDVILQQGDNEIIMSRKTLRGLVDQLLNA